MEPNSYSGSAKIFTFPSGGRDAEHARREEAGLKEGGVSDGRLGQRLVSRFSDAGGGGACL